MKKFLLSCIALLLSISGILASETPQETLRYKVLYKWGLIQKQAGNATITLTRIPDGYKACLYARSEPWADHFYKLRDTLYTSMRPTDMTPTRYERVSNENGRYTHDVVKFTRHADSVKGESTRLRRPKNSNQTIKTVTKLSAEGVAVDFLSSFYYLRKIDFDSFIQNQSVSLNIFSGKKKEILTITYIKKENVKIDNKIYPAIKLVFRFTSNGRIESSSPLEAWISDDAQRIPLKVVGQLKIGKIQCFYIPDK